MQNPLNESLEAPVGASPLASVDDSILAPAVAASLSAASAEEVAVDKKKKKKRKHKMRVEHKSLGRVRMKFSSAKGDEATLQEIAQTYSVIPGVERITVNPDTGSVVLHYDHTRHADFDQRFERHCSEHAATPPKTELDEVADKIENEAEFLAQYSHSAKALLHICKRLDREIKEKTNNTLDLKIGLAGGLIAVTLLEVGAMAATPIWLTLGVFSLNHFLELQHRQQLMEHIKKAAAPPSAPIEVKAKAAAS